MNWLKSIFSAGPGDREVIESLGALLSQNSDNSDDFRISIEEMVAANELILAIHCLRIEIEEQEIEERGSVSDEIQIGVARLEERYAEALCEFDDRQ